MLSKLLRNFSNVVETQSKYWSIYHPKPDYPHIVNNEELGVKPQKGKRDSIRSAVLATKIGMTFEWDKWGVRHPLTVLQIDRCHVVQNKTKEIDGYDAVQLGGGERSLRKVAKPQVGHYIKANVPPKQKLKESKVSPDCFLPLGYQLTSRHFIVGQLVDVQGVSKGKGFQGCVKRWGFSKQPASHGNSKAHRRPGTIGGGQDPGRVWPGKKMPGRMGGKNVTVEKCKIYKIDHNRELIYIKGSVPGAPGGIVKIRDAFKDTSKTYRQVPHPTYVPKEGEELPEVETMPAPELDSFETMFLHENVLNLRPYIEDPEEMVPPMEDKSKAEDIA